MHYTHVYWQSKRKFCFIASFDESYNNVIKTGQTDLDVRYWEGTRNHVATRHVDSSFTGKSFFSDIYKHFKSCTETLEDAKHLKVSLVDLM